MNGIRLIIVLVFLGWNKIALSQTIPIPKAFLQKDSIQIGEPFQLTLHLNHSRASTILFPDTSYDFSPFELIKKDFFPTRTVGEQSRDCVVYELATFIPDSSFRLRLPVFQVANGDSTAFFSNEVHAVLIPSLSEKEATATLPKEEIQLLQVPKSINYPYIILGMAAVVVLLLLFNIFFDRPIQKFIYLLLEKRRYDSFMRQFEKQSRAMERELLIERMENLIVNWKRYLERIDGRPFTSFTSAEFYKALKDNTLRDSLMEVDRWIYGGLEMKDWKRNVDYFRHISDQMYQLKRERIRNGKFN